MGNLREASVKWSPLSTFWLQHSGWAGGSLKNSVDNLTIPDNTGTFHVALLLIFSPPLILQGTLQVMLYEGTVGIIPWIYLGRPEL